MDHRPQGKYFLSGWLVENQTLALVGLFSFMVGAVTVAVGGNVDVLGRLLLAQSSVDTCKAGCGNMQGSTTDQINACKTACDTAAAGGSYGTSYGGSMTPESCRVGCDSMTSGDKDACKRGCDSMGTGGSYGTSYGGMTGGTSAMKNCTYPHALLTADPYKEVSVWCEGDYVNCKGPNGSLTRDQIKSLGGPSTCESYGGGGMTGGGTYGGTTGGMPADGYTTGGGTTGGDMNSPYKMCWQGCGCSNDTDCGSNDCFNRYCKPMLGGSTATPTTGTSAGTTPSGGGTIAKKCTYPNGTILYCVSDHVSCRRSMNMSDPVLTNAEVGSIGSTANCISISGDANQGSTGGGTTGPTWCTYPQARLNNGTAVPELSCEGNNCKGPNGAIPFDQISFRGPPTACVPGGSGGGNYGGGDAPWPVGDTSPWGRCMDACRVSNPSAKRYECDSKCASASWNNGSYDPSTCISGCNTMTGTEEGKQSCRNACNNAARGTTYPRDGSYPTGSTYDSASCLRGCNDPVMMAGRSEAEKQMCRDGCNTMGGTRPAAGQDSQCPAGQVLCSPRCAPGGACPAVMPRCVAVGTCNEGVSGDGGYQGGQSGVDQWALSNVRQSLQRANEEIQKLQGVSKQYGVDISAAISGITGEMKNVGVCLEALQPGMDVWTCDQKVHNNINPAISALWQKMQSANNNQQISQYNQQVQHMSDAIAKAQSAGMNASSLMQIRDAFQSALAAGDINAANQVATQFWPTFNQLMMPGQMGQNGPGQRMGGYGSDGVGSCADIERKMQHTEDPAVVTQLQGYLNTCLTYAQQSATGQKFDQRKFDNLQGQFEQTINQQGDRNACEDAKRSITDTRKMISSEAPQMIAKVAKSRPAVAEKLNGLLAQAKDTLARAEKAQAGGDCSAALDAMSDMDALGQQADALIGQGGVDLTFNDTTDDIQDIYDNVGEESDVRFADFRKQMETKGYRTKDFSLLKQMDPSLIAEYLQFTKTGNEGGGDIVKVAAQTDIDTLAVEEILQTKNDLLRQIDELKGTIATLKAGVRSIISKIQNYTFNPAVADDVASLVADASDLSEKDLAAKFAALKEESQEQNVEDGITAFKDIDPFDGQDWFAGAAKNLAEDGIVKGEGDGRFNPTGDVNGAQLVAFIDRAFDGEEKAADLDLAEVETPKMPAWAEESALRVGAVLESDGDRSLGSILPTNAGEPVTRADVAEVLVGFIGHCLPEFDASYVRPDVKTYRESIQEAQARLTEAGIMAGSDNAWKPDADVSRAEMVTVLDRAMECASQAEDAGTGDDSADADGGDDAAFSPDTTELPRTQTPPEEHEAAEDPAACIARMCAKLVIGSMSYNRCKEACYGTQATTAEAPPTGDPGFSIDTGVTVQQFKVIMSILANWLSTHKRTEAMYPTALKLQTDLGLALQEHTSYNDPTRLIVPYNKLSGDRYRVLWAILAEANQATMQ